MKPGDLVQPVHIGSGVPCDRVVFLGDKLPWYEAVGMVGERHPFPSGSIALLLEEQVVHLREAKQEPRVFCKILTSDDKVGWLHESWIGVVNEAR